MKLKTLHVMLHVMAFLGLAVFVTLSAQAEDSEAGADIAHKMAGEWIESRPGGEYAVTINVDGGSILLTRSSQGVTDVFRIPMESLKCSNEEIKFVVWPKFEPSITYLYSLSSGRIKAQRTTGGKAQGGFWGEVTLKRKPKS
jgi:hypothetical protein